MPKPKLILHVGSPKTGTTAIQAALTASAATLAAGGICYPASRPYFKGSPDAHIAWAHAMQRRRFGEKLKLWRYRRNLHRISRTYPVTVLSAEPLYRHALGQHPDVSEAAWVSGHRAYLKSIKSYLSDFDVQPVVYLRDPADFAVSMFKEGVMRHRPHARQSLADYLTGFKAHFRYPLHTEALQEIFGSLEIRDFEAERDKGLVPQFFRYLGVEPPEQKSKKRIRTSVGNRAALWLKSSFDLDRQTYKERVFFCLNSDSNVVLGDTEGSVLWPDADVYLDFCKRHGDSYGVLGRDVPTAFTATPAELPRSDKHAADAAFLAWRSQNAERLAERQRLRLQFFEPDPV